MSSYMNLIEDSLAASEAKAKEISRIIAEQSALASRNLEEEIGRLEETSGDQIAQAARMLRDQHERAMAAMNEMLSSTASDFQQTAQDMRLTAQQVVKDIDAARGELKRALLELPEETRTNADAMRRVVADQINALAALADAVKRQTGTLDVSGPGVGRGREELRRRRRLSRLPPSVSACRCRGCRARTSRRRSRSCPCGSCAGSISRSRSWRRAPTCRTTTS